MKVDEILNEEVDLSMYDSLDNMVKYMKELQRELADAKMTKDVEYINQIEQDIFDVADMIGRKKAGK